MFKKLKIFLNGILDSLKRIKLINYFSRICSRIVSFIARNAMNFAIITALILLVSVIGILVINNIIVNNYPEHITELRKDLKSIINTLEKNKDAKELNKLMMNIKNKYPSVYDIVVTDENDNILGILKDGFFSDEMERQVENKANSNNNEVFNDSLMKKFSVSSDWGGLYYIQDQDKNIRYIAYGEYGKKTLIYFQNIYDSSCLLGENIAVSPASKWSSSTGWIDDNGELVFGGEEQKIANPMPYTDVIIVKPKVDSYNLYAFEYSGIGFGQGVGMVLDNLIYSVREGYFFSAIVDGSLFQELMEVIYPDKTSIIIEDSLFKYQVIREIFLATAIMSLIIFWICITIWVFTDARKKKFKPLPWTALVLITNAIGLSVYLAVCPKYTKCKNCSKEIPKTFASCPYCGSCENDKCSECGLVLDNEYGFCPSCGKQRRSAV